MRYKRVSTSEGSSPSASDREEAKKRRAELVDKINTKIHALFWVISSGSVMYYTDFLRVLFEDRRVNRPYFNLSLVCFGINCCLMFYLTIWLPYIKKITLSWNVYCPRVIPTMTIVGILCGFLAIVSLWPVWGFLTPFILGLTFLGMFFALHFIPWPC